MRIPSTTQFALLLAAFFTSHHALYGQHIHVNAGAAATEQDAPLYFPNGSVYDTNAGYDIYLVFTNGGPFSQRYQGAGVTFTALASTPDNGGPAFGHAADGAYLQLQFVSVSGPPNGVFSVWEQDPAEPGVDRLLFELPEGTTHGTNLFNLSEGDGSPGSDPYGHIHGRTFTANQPGLYTVGCRILDTSTNGAGGGPIHTPSDISFFYFQAGLTISSMSNTQNQFSIRFGTHLGASYMVETATNLAAPNWEPMAGPIQGNNYLQTEVIPSDGEPQFFVRVRSDSP